MIRTLTVGLLALSLSACATAKRLDAANDVHALLISIRDNDQAAFDAHVDRPALKRELEARMMAEARKDSRLGPLAAILAPGLAELAGEALVQPRVFRRVAEHYGYTPETRIPGAIAISQSLKPLPDGRMCATRKKDGPCLLMFTRDAQGHWRLSGFEGAPDELNLQI